jgi:hypothetical protein
VVPKVADHQANAETPGKSAAAERSEEIGHEANAESNPAGHDSKVQKTDSEPPGGCAPIGLTANGDLVFSMQCQEMIERHRRELASSEGAATAPDPAAAQAAPDAVEKDETRSSNRTNPDAEHQAAPQEPADGREAMKDDNAAGGRQGNVPTGESRSGGARPDLETTPRKSAKQKQIPQSRPETISRTAERRDARGQRLPPVSRSRRLADRGDSELWYNVLGLR